ncbi:DUF5947 family protein [Actinocorallia populi]|uniref:DUF5947 family protein n=1 Tax=Actinocorallia populi TaxID=2079200 RepID=UPI000D09033C|nr:DUF5947 family protein [Actinocorallia populi]
MNSTALGRVIRRAESRARERAEPCGMCGIPVEKEHTHLLDERGGALLCVCRACSVLFPEENGRYRRVPSRRIRLTGVRPDDLGVPVGLAFFTRDAQGAVTAHYPSPMGTTGWTVEPAVWAAAVAACPPLETLAPGVEALLVNAVRDADERWLVPVDDCYRLVAIIRGSWKGLSGGTRVWPEIEAFFTRLAEGESCRT